MNCPLVISHSKIANRVNIREPDFGGYAKFNSIVGKKIMKKKIIILKFSEFKKTLIVLKNKESA
jgi:hypothetical protein